MEGLFLILAVLDSRKMQRPVEQTLREAVTNNILLGENRRLGRGLRPHPLNFGDFPAAYRHEGKERSCCT